MRNKKFLYTLIIFLLLILVNASVLAAYDAHYYEERRRIENNPNLTPAEKRLHLDNLERSWQKSESSGGQNSSGSSGQNINSDDTSSNVSFWDSEIVKMTLRGLVVAAIIILIKLIIDSIRRRKRARERYEEYSGKKLD